MLQLVLSTALSGLAVLPPMHPPQENPTVLFAAPADALFVAYSPDVGAVRDAVLERPWYRFFQSGPGREYVDLFLELMHESDSELENVLPLFRPLCEVCDTVRGEAMVFATTDGLGIVLETGERQEAADQALTSFLEGLSVEWTLSMSSYQDVPLQLWQPVDKELVIGRAWGSGITALVLGESMEKVVSTLREGVDDLGAGELSLDARRISERLRGGVPRVVFTADLQKIGSIVAAEAEKPRQVRKVCAAIGLDREAWVLGDVHQSPSGAIHELVKVRFQPETGLARLADSFRPLEMNDLADLPEGTDYFGIVRWDVRSFVDTVLDLSGPEARKAWRNGLQAGEAATGVHFRRDLIEQLTGLFAYGRDGEIPAERILSDPLQGATLLIGVRDGDAVADTLLDLLEATGSSHMIEVDDVEGMDVWSFEGLAASGVDAPAMPRLVFAPEAILVVSAAQDLERLVGPLTGAGKPSLSDESAPVEALRRHAGAFFVGYQDLASTVGGAIYQFHGMANLLGLEVSEPPDRATMKEWFPGHAVSSWVRTDGGLEFRTTIQ